MESERDMDGLLVDWLYGELEGEEKRRFEAYLEGSAEARARAEAMRQTREAFRDLADAQEEPPAAVSSILLHEAAVRARKRPASERQGGFVAWLSNLTRPLVLHPAATAVATLALVAGVAGTLYVRQADQVSPAAKSAAPAPAAETTTLGAAEEPAPPAPAEAAADMEEGYVAGVADEDTQAQLERADEALAEKRAPAREPGKARKLDDKGSVSGRIAARDRKRAPVKKEKALADGVTANAVSGADPVPPTEARGELAVAQPASRDAEFARAPEAGAASYRAAPEAKDGSADERWAARQSVALARAVEAKQCREAATIANDIRERSPEYFRREVEGSKTVAPCKWYVAEERRQRLARRKAARQKAESKDSGAAAESERAEEPADKK